jgi:phospholipid/cholesterol/gamma-HCH transport system substrate-binding protein
VNARLGRYSPLMAVAAAVLVLAAVIGVLAGTGSTPTRTLWAQFSETPGLYAGNDVDVLGIQVGHVMSIRPEAGYVLVRMSVASRVTIPAGASAVLMAPEVVSDRFIQLGPAYTGGPDMAAGAVIPLSRTAIPESVDAVISTLKTLADQLGPNGANRNGALSALVHQLAVELGPNGQDFRATIQNFSQALGGLTAAGTPAELADTLDHLGNLSQALAGSSATYSAFASALDQVSAVLAADRTDISATLSALQTLFANLTSFIDRDGAALGSSISNLDTFASALASQQQALASVYDLTPLALQNISNAVDKNAPGGPALVGRYDPVASTATLFNQVCGSAALRFLVILATGTQTNPLTVANTTDTLCGIGNALNALTPPPGSIAGPDLTLKALVP